MKANLNRRKIWISVSAIIIIVLVLAGSFLYLNNSNSNSGKLSVTIGVIPIPQSGLLYIAQNQSYYDQSGLNVTLKSSLSGVAALNDLISGKIDVATAPEFPVVSQVLNNNSNLSIISTFSKSTVDVLIARTDRGIQNASDLVGKKIGVGFGGIGQFYLDRYLSLNHISPSSVTIVNIPPQQQADALVNGTIDALERDYATLSLVQHRLGDNAVVALPTQVGQPNFLNLVCRSDWLANNTQTIQDLLKALSRAEQYYQSNPSQAQSIILHSLNLTDIDPSTWSNSQFVLSLEQLLVVAMKDEAQWMINNHLTNQTRVPNVVDYIYTDGLKAVKPDAVTIIK